MRWSVWLPAVFLAALLVTPRSVATDRSADVVWLFPLPHSLLTNSPVVVYGYVLGKPRYSLDGWVVGPDADSVPREVPVDTYRGKAFVARVDLAPGRNRVVIGPATLELLYRPGFGGQEKAGFQKPVVHQAADGPCSPCHGYVSGRLVLKKAASGMCLSCHKLGTESLRAVIRENEHTRSVTPSCLRCHTPHASFQAALVRTGENVCLPCHVEYGQLSRHDGDRSQPCMICHDPHGSAYPSLARRPNLRLCAPCHGSVSAPSPYPVSYHRPVMEDVEKVHAPVYKRHCTACHDPHLGVRNYRLLEQPVALCLWCHGTLFRDLEVGHGPFGKGGDCYTCHVAHISDYKPLLKKPLGEVCAECHENVLREDPGPGSLLHGALAGAGCSGCHDAHGSRTATPLRASAPDLCTACHTEIMLSPDGQTWRELHPPVQARDCMVCHRLGHARDEADDAFLVAAGRDLCTPCHTTPPEHVPASWRIKMLAVEDNCLRCHLPHGGDDWRMLRPHP